MSIKDTFEQQLKEKMLKSSEKSSGDCNEARVIKDKALQPENCSDEAVMVATDPKLSTISANLTDVTFETKHENLIDERCLATNQKENVSILPNPNNASKDACKHEVATSNKYEEGACNKHNAQNAEKTELGVQKNVNFPEEQVCSSIRATKQEIEPKTISDSIKVETSAFSNEKQYSSFVEPEKGFSLDGNTMTSSCTSSLPTDNPSLSTVDIPIIKERQLLNDGECEVDEASKNATNALELFSKNTEEESDQKDPNTDTAQTRNERFECSVEKEIIEKEGSTIERTTRREEQIITQRQVKTSEESFTLTPEELFERFPELRSTILNNASQNTKSEVVVGGQGTLDDPATMTASQEQSKITSETCPDDKDTTMITINKSILTKHTAKGYSSSNSNGAKEGKSLDDEDTTKVETGFDGNQKESPTEVKTPTSSSSETVKATQEPEVAQSKQGKKKYGSIKDSNKNSGQNKACCNIS